MFCTNISLHRPNVHKYINVSPKLFMKRKYKFCYLLLVKLILVDQNLLIQCKYWQENKTWWQLHKNTTSNIEPVLEATPQKIAAIRPPTTHHETIQVRRTRHAGHCWRSKDELISDILLWTPSHGRAKAGRPARTYIQQLCADTGCRLGDLPGAMDDCDGWVERVWEIRGGSAIWWGLTRKLAEQPFKRCFNFKHTCV